MKLRKQIRELSKEEYKGIEVEQVKKHKEV